MIFPSFPAIDRASVRSDGGKVLLQDAGVPKGAENGSSVPPVLICLLGRFRLYKGDQPVTLRGRGKVEVLLGMLALRPHVSLPRATLLDLVWPGNETALAYKSLNTLIYSLHRLLGDALGGKPPVIHDGENYQLNLNAGVEVDTILFDALVRRGDLHRFRENLEAAAIDYEQALDLYQGDLWSVIDPHALIERERLSSLYLTLRARLADYYFAAGNYHRCLDHAVRLLAKEPCREDAHRIAMRSFVRLGERAQALRQYHLCEQILWSEFEAKPELATTELYDQIRANPSGI